MTLQELRQEMDRLAIGAAAFAMISGHREINGSAVVALSAFIETQNSPLDADHRRVALGRAFDRFAAAVVERDP